MEEIVQNWMIFTSQKNETSFRKFLESLADSYKHLIDAEFFVFSDGGHMEEGPSLTRLPDGVVSALKQHLTLTCGDYCVSNAIIDLLKVQSILEVLIILARNFDNLQTFHSVDFVADVVQAASVAMQQITQTDEVAKETNQTVPGEIFCFLKLSVYFLECLYDPYFIWRGHLRGWKMDQRRMTTRPVAVRPEVVLFLYECFEKESLGTDLLSRFLHMFGATMAGDQTNALCVVTPATLCVLLKLLPSNKKCQRKESRKEEILSFKKLVLKCLVKIIHIIHTACPEQRQVEVSQVLEDYLTIMLHYDIDDQDDLDLQTLISMIEMLQEVLACQDSQVVQVLLVGNGALDSLITLLDTTALTGSQAQRLALTCITVVTSVLQGSELVKERFRVKAGYEKLLTALKSIGQPEDDLLSAVMDMVVEGNHHKQHTIQNAQAAVMLLGWLPDIQSHDLQIWVAKNLAELCGWSQKNKMRCCQSHMIQAILNVLSRQKQINSKAVGHLIGLLEVLGTHSIKASDLKQLIGLLQPDDDDRQNPHCSRLMHAMSVMARREGKDGALNFFSMQEAGDKITLPGFRKWPGAGYSFHCWLCLDVDLDLSSYALKSEDSYRRILYSFVSDVGSGFEVFVTTGFDLVMAVYSRKEYSAVTVTETRLGDSHWHSVSIVHTSGRRPFGSSQLSVYIDGRLKHSSSLKAPNMAEHYVACHIGSPCSSDTLSCLKEHQDGDGCQDNKKHSPLSFLRFSGKQNKSFSLSTSPGDPSIHHLPWGEQDQLWGQTVSLHGVIGAVCLFHDALQANHVKNLYMAGPNKQTIFVDESHPEMLELAGKLEMHLDAKACKDNVCHDLSSNGNHGYFQGQRCFTWDIKDVINSIGGIQVLIPLLEHVHKCSDIPDLSLDELIDPPEILCSDEQEEWVVIPNSAYADAKLEHNQVAGFLTLVRHMVHTNPTNQDTFVRTNCAATIGAILQKVPSNLLDVNVLMSIQLLKETTAMVNKRMLNHLYQFILFDFRIWSKSDFPVRIGHIQYLNTIIKDDKQYFRKKFGVQFILDVVRLHYSSATACSLSPEDAKTIRMSLLNLVKYYMSREPRIDEVTQVIRFLITTSEEELVMECLDMLIALLEMRHKEDQIYLMLFEPEKGELLFGMLISPDRSVMYYEKIVKVLHLLLKTDKVAEKYKSRLRLTECGLQGLVSIMKDHCDVSGPMIRRFLEIVMSQDTPQTYNFILTLLHLIHYSCTDIKLEASKQILSLLVTRPSATKQFAKQLGWQESFSKLLIFRTKERTHENSEANRNSTTISDDSVAKLDTKNVQSGEEGVPGKTSTSVVSEGQGQNIAPDLGNLDPGCMSTEAGSFVDTSHGTSSVTNSAPGLGFETSDITKASEINTYVPSKELGTSAIGESGLSSTSKANNDISPQSFNLSLSLSNEKVAGPKFGLDLNADAMEILSMPSELQTPMFVRQGKFEEDLGMLDEEEIDVAMSCSSSVSTEELTTLGRHADSRASTSSMSVSVSTSSISDAIADSRSRWMSIDEGDSSQHALELLGIKRFPAQETQEKTEELCQNILIILLSVMWKGLEGSDKAVWKERGQVITWIDRLAEGHDLIKPQNEVKGRLLELMIHSCSAEVRDAGSNMVAPSENALVLVRLIHHFLHREEALHTSSYTSAQHDMCYTVSPNMIEELMSMLDMLSVWDVETEGGWKDMARMGLDLLVLFAKHQNMELCALATAKLHNLVRTKLISSSAEASYIISSLYTVIVKAVQENTDNYAFLIPVLKALIDKAFDLLNLDLNLPNLPPISRSPTFFDDFRSYCLTEEWTNFVANYMNPQMTHFVENTFGDLSAMTQEFLESCQKEMMMNMHKWLRECGDSKLKFQNQIMDTFKARKSQEHKRFQNMLTQQKNQHLSSLRSWRAMKLFLTGERGAWADRESREVHWKLSNQENFSRMKVKLIPNHNFTAHRDASMLRDNMGANESDIQDQLQKLSVAKEAVVSKEDIGDDVILDEDWNISADSNEEFQGKEKLVLSEECELVTLMEVVKGRLEITNLYVYFFDCSINKEEGGEDFKWPISHLREIHFRRYNLRRSALELFLIDQTNYFLNFQPKERNRVYSCILGLRPTNLIYYGSRSPAELLKSSGLTQKWVQREISNFDYLIQLNTIAGRTYNDLSQYPVFPWILKDYISPTLDLDDPDVYRDLSKPLGVVNPRNVNIVQDRYDNFEDPSGFIEKFHYGTHYSNAAGVMHFLIRMEPFTTLHIQLQSGKFDVADRQFHSVTSTWDSLMDNPNDVKELIPEFFYLPEFLVNYDNFDLGQLQLSHEPVNDVLLPRWAESPEDFIYKHRQALESEYVSNNLHHWVDLIFGYKQKGPEAVKALNVFYYCTYEGAVDLDAIKDPRERKALEGMINNFGQTPCQLLKDPHPRRLTLSETVAKQVKADKPLNVFHFLDQLKVFFVEVSQDKDPIAFITVARNQTRSLIQHGMPDTMVTISEKGVLGLHGWLPYDKSISNYFTFEKDPSIANAKMKKKMVGEFLPGLKVDYRLFVVSHDNKLLFSGGHWDNSLQVHLVAKGKKISHIVRHTDIVTCLALDYCGNHLITGSKDTTCLIWQIMFQGGVSHRINNKPVQTLYGHDATVTAVHISTELDMAVSASKDGTVIIHTVRKGHYMRTLRPECAPEAHLSISHLAVDEMGSILLSCCEHFPVQHKEAHLLHLYSVNGKHLFSERLQASVGHMVVAGDNLLLGDSEGRLIVYEIFGLKVMKVLPLHVPIHSLALTSRNSHILAGLRDGKLIIIGVANEPRIR